MGNAGQTSTFPELLIMSFVDALSTSLSDLRSGVVKEAAITVAVVR